MASTSRNPRVVSSPTVAKVLSMAALVATVVPWASDEISEAFFPVRSRIACSAEATAFDGSWQVDGTVALEADRRLRVGIDIGERPADVDAAQTAVPSCVGWSFPLWSTNLGKALLAHLPTETVHEWLSSMSLPKFTRHDL